jgi:hypothetical protein
LVDRSLGHAVPIEKETFSRKWIAQLRDRMGPAAPAGSPCRASSAGRKKCFKPYPPATGCWGCSRRD